MYVFGFTHNFPPALGQKVITEACGAPLKDCCLVGFLVRVFSLTCLLIGYRVLWGFPGYAVVKNPPASAGDARDGGSIPGWGRSPGGGNGNPLQYSWLENSMDRGAWGGLQSVGSQSWTWLSDGAHTHRVVLGEGEQSKATGSLTTAIPNQNASRGSNPRGTLPPQWGSRVKPQMDRWRYKINILTCPEQHEQK